MAASPSVTEDTSASSDSPSFTVMHVSKQRSQSRRLKRAPSLGASHYDSILKRVGIGDTESLESVARVRRPLKVMPTNRNLEWVPLVEGVGQGDINEPTWSELRSMDVKRKNLLTLARETSASASLFKLSALPRTVLPRLIRKPLVWLIVCAFALGSILSRLSVFDEATLGEVDALLEGTGTGGGTVVTFMVVFYVGYCYTRNNQQFDDVQ